MAGLGNGSAFLGGRHAHPDHPGSQAWEAWFELAYSPSLSEGRDAMIFWVSRETVMTWPMRRRMYWGSASRLGSLTMPERASVETRYWSMTHSRAERLPRR